jgi:hypothetical protein
MMERGATAILKNVVKDETASLQGREVPNGLKYLSKSETQIKTVLGKE